uniref:ATP synthase F0 subunit 8 n=1 Tax=Romanomermis culicivorax TaxID=13658 RepID=A0A915KKC1_ROMCU
MIPHQQLPLLISWFIATTSLTFLIFVSSSNKRQIEAAAQADKPRSLNSNALQDVSCCDQESEHALK